LELTNILNAMLVATGETQIQTNS